MRSLGKQISLHYHTTDKLDPSLLSHMWAERQTMLWSQVSFDKNGKYVSQLTMSCIFFHLHILSFAYSFINNKQYCDKMTDGIICWNYNLWQENFITFDFCSTVILTITPSIRRKLELQNITPTKCTKHLIDTLCINTNKHKNLCFHGKNRKILQLTLT